MIRNKDEFRQKFANANIKRILRVPFIPENSILCCWYKSEFLYLTVYNHILYWYSDIKHPNFPTDSSKLLQDFIKLENIDGLRDFNTSNVVNFDECFRNLISIQSFDPIKDWNISNVESMNYTFSGNNLISLRYLNNWKPDKVTSMIGTFSFCPKLLDVSHIAKWNVSNLLTMKDLFYECESLMSISPLKDWNVKQVKDMSGCLRYCYDLTNIDALAYWDFNDEVNLDGMFIGDENLENLGDIFRIHDNFYKGAKAV